MYIRRKVFSVVYNETTGEEMLFSTTEIPGQREYSIQSGHPDKGGSLSRELLNRSGVGALVGSALGTTAGVVAGIQYACDDEYNGGLKDGLIITGIGAAGGAIIGAMINAFDMVWAGKRKREAANTNMNELVDYLLNSVEKYRQNDVLNKKDVRPERYIVEDQDPSKFMVSFAYEDSKLVIFLNNPSDEILSDLNDDLEDMIKYNRKADYASERVKNGYFVYVTLPNLDSAAEIIYNLISTYKIKVNAITEKMLKKLKRK